MKQKKFKDFWKSNKEQKENQKILFNEFLIIIGAILLAEGFSYLIPNDKSFLLGIGMLLVILGVLNKKSSA